MLKNQFFYKDDNSQAPTAIIDDKLLDVQALIVKLEEIALPRKPINNRIRATAERAGRVKLGSVLEKAKKIWNCSLENSQRADEKETTPVFSYNAEDGFDLLALAAGSKWAYSRTEQATYCAKMYPYLQEILLLVWRYLKNIDCFDTFYFYQDEWKKVEKTLALLECIVNKCLRTCLYACAAPVINGKDYSVDAFFVKIERNWSQATELLDFEKHNEPLTAPKCGE